MIIHGIFHGWISHRRFLGAEVPEDGFTRELPFLRSVVRVVVVVVYLQRQVLRRHRYRGELRVRGSVRQGPKSRGKLHKFLLERGRYLNHGQALVGHLGVCGFPRAERQRRDEKR